ncbi:MAG TPA: 16S rRNA (adenine(1518)-N(6)/adenine(1519)-N(6))-dimethyltransferase RsmA, partial [Candidatus Saccharimonadales bacterium]
AWGQHWLKDMTALIQLVELAEVEKTDSVLEIGPGQGDLTRQLLKSARRVIAVEIDSRLAAALRRSFSGAELEVVNQDILGYDLKSLPPGYKVVANLPYNLTAPIIQKLINVGRPGLIVLLLQKEVAERLAAGPGNLSMLALSVQLYYRVELGPMLPARLFQPTPKVDSRAIKLRRLAKTGTKVEPEKLLKLAKIGFAMKRKTLANALSAGRHQPRAEIIDALTAASLPSRIRAQDLSLADWQRLYDKLYNYD